MCNLRAILTARSWIRIAVKEGDDGYRVHSRGAVDRRRVRDGIAGQSAAVLPRTQFSPEAQIVSSSVR